jgi:hypothetical protein
MRPGVVAQATRREQEPPAGSGRRPARKECDMGDIGTERREVEFEPLTEDPVPAPARRPEPAPAPAPATDT